MTLDPPNDGNLPLADIRDDNGTIVARRIIWRGSTIRQQFPWTRALNESESA